MGDGVHHVMSAEGVRDFHAEVAAHELAEVGLVVQRVAALAIGIEPLHLTLRTLAGCPHEEQRLALAVGVGNGGQSADAAHVGIGVLGEVENLLPTRTFAVNAAEDGRWRVLKRECFVASNVWDSSFTRHFTLRKLYFSH